VSFWGVGGVCFLSSSWSILFDHLLILTHSEVDFHQELLGDGLSLLPSLCPVPPRPKFIVVGILHPSLS
jgi:hypothetical protein